MASIATSNDSTNDRSPKQHSSSMELAVRISTFFRQHREARGQTVAEVAQTLGIEAAELAAYEAGTSAFSLDLIFSLTNIFNIPPEDVLNLVYDLQSQQVIE